MVAWFHCIELLSMKEEWYRWIVLMRRLLGFAKRTLQRLASSFCLCFVWPAAFLDLPFCRVLDRRCIQFQFKGPKIELTNSTMAVKAVETMHGLRGGDGLVPGFNFTSNLFQRPTSTANGPSLLSSLLDIKCIGNSQNSNIIFH